jgi:hypothetical protein
MVARVPSIEEYNYYLNPVLVCYLRLLYTYLKAGVQTELDINCLIYLSQLILDD